MTAATAAQKSWEYKAVFAADSSSMEDQLNKFSKQGYVLSHFQVVHPSGHKATFYCILVREKLDQD